MRKIGIILSLLTLIVGGCGQATKKQEEMANNKIAIEENNQNKISDKFVYYKERIIISWLHNDGELNEYRSQYTEEEWDVVIDDEVYYSGSAYIYFDKKGEDVVVTKADSIGFIYQQDTVILDKKGIYEYTKKNQRYTIGQEDGKGFWDVIILFDGKKKPVITIPVDVFYDNDEYSWFFKK